MLNSQEICIVYIGVIFLLFLLFHYYSNNHLIDIHIIYFLSGGSDSPGFEITILCNTLERRDLFNLSLYLIRSLTIFVNKKNITGNINAMQLIKLKTFKQSPPYLILLHNIT